MTTPETARRSRLRPFLRLGLGLAILGALAWGGLRLLRSRVGSDPVRLRQAAITALQANDWSRAVTHLERLRALKLSTSDDLIRLGLAYNAQAREDDALAAYAAIPDSDPNAATARLFAGQLELRRNRIAHAEKLLIAAVTLDPAKVQAHRELVYIYGMQVRRADLGKEFQALQQLGPLTDADVFLWCLTRGSVWEGKEHASLLRKFVEADPQDRFSRLALADAFATQNDMVSAYRAIEPLPDSDPAARAARARLAMKEGETQALSRLLADVPDDHAELLRLRGQVALSRRDTDTAVESFRAAEALEPGNRETVFGLGRALQLAGDTEAARPYLELARKLDHLSSLVQRAATPEARQSLDLRLQLAAACEDVGRLPEARAWYRLAIELDPFNAVAQKALFRLSQPANPAQPARAPAPPARTNNPNGRPSSSPVL